jgi:dTDP-4-dehydrorhamnose 3,5-epimerase
MNTNKTLIPGVIVIEPPVFSDQRGVFVKTFNREVLNDEKINFSVEESFYSVSKEHVIRGMHFQYPPMDHAKFVYCPSGKILDVILDIRKGSPTYGQFATVELSPENGKVVLIPSGCAHGFISLRDHSVTVYLQSSVRSAEHEAGVRFDSFGMDWRTIDPITSERDTLFPTLSELDSPFTYHE